MSGLLAGAGVLIAAAAAAAAFLLRPGRARSAAMLVALILFPVLIVADQWHSVQIVDLRHHPARLVALALAAVALSGILAGAFRRWPALLPLAIVAVLPFRIPLHAGGQTANLLVPLYLVIAGGVLTAAFRDWTRDQVGSPAGGAGDGGVEDDPADRASPSPATGPAGRAVRWLPPVLAAVVVLYAVQALYSPDFSKSVQNVCFFLVPFSLVYALLREVRWDRRLLALVFCVVAVEAAAFVVVGSVEYLSKSLFWNAQVIRSNEFHTYFRVNSVFWDPNIYGRYLALAIVLAMAPVLWAPNRRAFVLLTALVALFWVGLVPTFSESSFAALLGGLAVLAALRWGWRWALGGLGVVAASGALIVVLVGGFSFSRINIDTSGRANLVSGGIHLFADRPVWGYGSGSFPRAYREHVKSHKVPVTISHTEPVTVAAEQGLLGLAAYLALIAVALWSMTAGLRAAFSRTFPAVLAVARAAVLAAFVALLVHTMAYAGFFEDPITWVLLALSTSLASIPVRGAA